MDFSNLLRVPPIFVVDELFKNSFGFYEFMRPLLFDLSIKNTVNTVNGTGQSGTISEYTKYNNYVSLSMLKMMLSGLIFCLSWCLFVLPSKYLYSVYIHVVSVCVVLLSYWTNTETMKLLSRKFELLDMDYLNDIITWDVNGIINLLEHLQNLDFLYTICSNIILQLCLALVFNFLQMFSSNYSILKILIFSFIIPTFIALIPGTQEILNTGAVIATFLPLFIMLKFLWLNLFTISNFICEGYRHTQSAINFMGLYSVIKVHWFRLNIPTVLLIFWSIKLLEPLLYLSTDMEIEDETMYGITKYLLIKGCDTFIAVLGMTSFVSFVCHYIGLFLQWVMLTDDTDTSIKTVSAFLFFVLALQSGLTDLMPKERSIKLYINVILLSSALLHYIHNKVHSLLMFLSASPKITRSRHFRALFGCVFLIVFSVTQLTYLWSQHSISSWLVSVTLFDVEVIIKELVSLAMYALFLIDVHCETLWETIDDYVLYIKAFGSMVEFCFSVFLFLNGLYILFFLPCGAFCAAIIYVHAHHKTWSNGWAGWKMFKHHRRATKRIESLQEATSAQLAEFNDVCSICYQNMKSAKITKCSHYFHSVCLRQWHYSHNRCPVCNDILINKSNLT